MSEKNFFVHIFGGMWKIWDFLCRLVINSVITVLVLVFVIGGLGARHVIVPSSAALVVDLQGDLVEQFSGDPTERAIDRFFGQRQQQPQTRLRDVVQAIDKARYDGRIKALVLATDEMHGAGLEQLETIARAVHEFEKSHKPVFAIGDSYDQAQYYLAATADVVFIHPQGRVFLRGFGLYQPYFKDALDKLGVDWNVFRVGKYKSAVEPFLRNDMSPEAREDYTGLLGSLWTDYQVEITRDRKLPGDAVKNYIDDLPGSLAAVNGDDAKLALEAKLVDKVAEPDQMQDAVAKVVGRSGHGFRSVEYRQYLEAVDGDQHGAIGGDKVGVVVAEGDIMDGDQPPGAIGGDSTSELIREARDDDSIKALVLRVNSPGGSSFASDLILREVELTKEAGKPVVVSMGDVAASGGYWISMGGDRIYASPATITGSIGIFGMLPTFQDSLAKLGVHSDGVGTTKLSDAFDLTRSMTPDMKQVFQLSIDHGYEQFITKVAKNRHMKVEDVDAIAQGRVWSGSDAKRLGLVDVYGDLDDAVQAAAKLADLGNRYTVDYIEKQPSFLDRLLMNMAEDSDSTLRVTGTEATLPSWYGEVIRLAGSLKVFNDPRGIYAYCFCDVR